MTSQLSVRIFTLCVLAVGCLVSNSSAQASAQRCSTVSFTVTGTAQNYNLPSDVPLGNLTQLLAAVAKAGLVPVSGSQTIAGTFCLPSVQNSNNSKLQVLFSSITANRGQWQALGGLGTKYPQYQPENYSWTDYANAQGYPTLALDRLGTGLSSHPDPVLVVQAAYEIALYNNLATQLRAGTAGLPHAYNFLIYVGNSYGSQLGIGMAGMFPKAYDQYVLSGVSNNPQQDFAGLLLVVPAPAAVVDPANFGTLPAGYVTTSSQTGRTNSFFGSPQQVSFDPAIPPLFFQRKDVVSVGQFVSIYAYPFSGAGFTGRVLVLDGQQDQAYCGPGSPVIGPADCTPDKPGTAALFPNANFNWHLIQKTGHAIPLFNSHAEIFASAHAFLAGASFQN